MRALTVVMCLGVLVAAGCREGATDRAISEAKNRKPDAGVVAPVPETATLLASGQNVPRNLVADDSHLYWLNEGLRAEGKPGIFRVSKSGGEPEALYEGKGVEGIVLAGGSVYAILSSEEKVIRLPKSGGQAEVVAEVGGLNAITSDGANVYWTSDEGISRYSEGGKPKTVVSGIEPPVGLAVDGPNLFFYSAISGDLSRAPAAGGKARKFFNQELTLHSYFAHDGNLFWSLGSDKKAEIRTTSSSGGGKPSVVTSGQSIPVELTADSNNVYWTTGDQVMRAPRSGGPASVVVDGTDRSMGVAVDGSAVYWTDRGGRIQKVSK